MKKQKRFLAMLVALAMCLSLLPAGVVRAEQAEGTVGDASSVYEPWAHGYRFVDILNWPPETDDYAEELVAQVPLQERIGTYAATQANPGLSDEPELYAMQGMVKTDNGKFVSRRSMERYSEAMQLYAATTESVASLADRFGFNACSFGQFLKRNFPELVGKHKELVRKEDA